MSAVGGVEVIDLAFIATEEITKFRFVKGSGTGDRKIEMADTQGEGVLGVAMHDVDELFVDRFPAGDGPHANVRLMGIAVVEAGATVTQYGPVMTTNDGRAINATATNRVAGVALTGGDAGEWISVVLAGPAGQIVAA